MPASRDQIRRYKQQLAIHRDRSSRLLVAAWDELSDYDDADIQRYTARTAAGLTAVKTAAVALSAAFFAAATRTRPAGIAAGDVPVEPRIRDPFLAAWHAVKQERPWDEAVAAGRSAAEAVGFDFVQSTARRTGDVAAERAGIEVRWQRVPGADSCDWCHTVAGQLYLSAESADFGHDRCDCDAVPA